MAKKSQSHPSKSSTLSTGGKPKSKVGAKSAAGKRKPAGKSRTKAAQAVRKAPQARPPREPGEVRYWLVKSEPDVFSIDDLANAPQKTTCWDGVRNYQARNMLRDEMLVGDQVLFYHSNAEPPGIVGVCKVVQAGYPDHTAWDPNDKHYDPKSKAAAPTWYMVDIKLVKKFRKELPLPELKQVPELDGMVLLQRGSRLSVQPVEKPHFELILAMGSAK